jgi:hypothetical protein
MRMTAGKRHYWALKSDFYPPKAFLSYLGWYDLGFGYLPAVGMPDPIKGMWPKLNYSGRLFKKHGQNLINLLSILNILFYIVEGFRDVGSTLLN